MRPKKKNRKNSATDHLDKSPSYHPPGGTSTEVRSPTSTSTEVRSPTKTSTSTDATTTGNITVTGGAGAGATTVTVHQRKLPDDPKSASHPSRKNPLGAAGVMTALSHTSLKSKAQAAITKFIKKKNPRSKNPTAEAEQMYELFHGMPPDEIITFIERIHVHTKLAGVGTLTSMIVQGENGRQVQIHAPDPDDPKVKKEDVVYVAVNEEGNQLFFRGGDQELPKELLERRLGLKADDFRDHMIIGAVLELTYRTKKSFEKGGAELVDFYHALGKEHSRGIVPMLVYYPRNPSMELFGGRYKVLPKRFDLDASPGIGG